MSNDKKYYKTTFTIAVLSEEPIPGDADLAAVMHEADTGSYVAYKEKNNQETLTGKQVADALYDAGSEPGFFMLNDDGEVE
jgi:hypothetical protein